MGRRAPDPRPPIEVVGAEPEIASVQRVSTGPGRPTGGRGRALALGVGVVGLLLGGLVLGGADDDTSSRTKREERDNRERAEIKPSTTVTTRSRSTTTRPPTTTTTIPVGPVFGQPVGALLLVFGQRGWTVVDLDTGARREVSLPTEDPYGVRAVTGGVVTIAPGTRQAVFYDLIGGGEELRSVELGPADQVLSAGRPDRVWLVDSGGVFEGEPTSDTVVRLVDLNGQGLRSFDVPGSYLTSGVSRGVVLERGGRAYLADESGVRAVATGHLVGATNDAVLMLACDDRAECAVELRPIDGGPPVALLGYPGVEDIGFDTAISPEGDIGLTGYGHSGDRPSLTLFTSEGRPLGFYDLAGDDAFGTPRWLPNGLGLLVPRGRGPEWIRPRGGEWVVEPTPALDGISAEVLVVIRP